MAEADSYLFDYREVAEALVKKLDIHEGFWGVGIEFGFAVNNIKTPNGFAPAAILPVNKIGLNRWQEPNNLTVDAAEVNPVQTKKASRDAPKAAAKVASKRARKK